MEINRCLYLDAERRLTLREEKIPIPGKGQILIKISANGICGSDLHFYKDGRLGNFVVDRPYIPGHEASGVIAANGPKSKKFKEGDRVVIEPGIPCGRCHWCKTGRYNLCPEVIFLSAPPINGTFCDYIAVDEHFVFPIPDGLSMEHAALAEPASVAVHAVNRGRIRPGDTSVIVGAGPIGLLTLQAFKASGGGRAVCIDRLPKRLKWAMRMGADEVFAASDTPAVRDFGDVVFETAGSDQATAQLFAMARPGGRCVQIGWPKSNHISLDIAEMMGKELDYVGLNRYVNAFEAALNWLVGGQINADMLITHTFSFEKAIEGFDWAIANPEDTIKVLITN